VAVDPDQCSCSATYGRMGAPRNYARSRPAALPTLCGTPPASSRAVVAGAKMLWAFTQNDADRPCQASLMAQETLSRFRSRPRRHKPVSMAMCLGYWCSEFGNHVVSPWKGSRRRYRPERACRHAHPTCCSGNSAMVRSSAHSGGSPVCRWRTHWRPFGQRLK
jgi:hypothetical protein